MFTGSKRQLKPLLAPNGRPQCVWMGVEKPGPFDQNISIYHGSKHFHTFTLSHSHDSSALFFPFQALGYLYLVYYYQNNRLTCSLGIFQPCLINSMSCIKDKANSGPVWHFRCTMVRWLIKKMLTPCSVVIFIEKQRISSMIDGPCLLGIIL